MHNYFSFAVPILIQKIIIYTDGAALNNPGPGGYAAVLMAGPHRKEIYGAFTKTTNNRMELLAVIEALRQLKQPGMDVTIHSDSKYVCDAINQNWLEGWIKKGWAKVKNVDLWKQFLPLYRYHKPKFVWVKGHAGVKENERCDFLATQAAKNGPFVPDAGFEAYVQMNDTLL